MIASAFAGPMPTSSFASVFASAVLMFTAPAKTTLLARASATPKSARFIFCSPVVVVVMAPYVAERADSSAARRKSKFRAEPSERDARVAPRPDLEQVGRAGFQHQRAI